METPFNSLLNMRNLIISLILLPTFLPAQEYWALLQTSATNFTAARELRQELVDDGRLVSLIYQPEWMVARLRSPAAEVQAQHPQILAIGEGPGGSQGMEAPPTLARFFEKMAAGGYDPIRKSKTEAPWPADPEPMSCNQREATPKDRTNDFALVNDYNSEYFRGLVATSVFFIESDGTEDPNYYSWTQAALEEEKMDVLMALHTWAYTAYLQDADLTFVPVWYDSRPEVNQGFEPNLHLGSFSFYPNELNQMTGSVLRNLGYQEEYVRAQAGNFSYDQRQAYASDFAFVIGVHYSHQSKGYIRANAMIGGPVTYLSREYDYRVYGHEIGHIFHAYDEYLNTDNCNPSGARFNGAINGNNLANSCREKQPCVMNDNAVQGSGDELHFAVCTYTATHFGWGADDLAPAPHILSEVTSPFTLPFIALEVDFPRARTPLEGYAKVWIVQNGRDSLIIDDYLSPAAGTMTWKNTKPLLPGTYKCVFYHGQKGQYALVPSEPVTFEVDYTPAFAFRDTCIYFCQTPEMIDLPQEGLRWYGEQNLETLVHEGGAYLPDFQTDSTLYLARFVGDQPVDIARVNILFGRPASVAMQSRVELDGRVALSVYSFLPIFNAHSFQWYRNGEPLADAGDWSIYPAEPGAYHAVIDNGCEIRSDTLQLIFPPQVEQTAICEERGYRIVASGENLIWYNDRRIPVSSGDTLTVTNVDRYQFYFVTQTVDGVESPFYEISLPPLNEEEPVDLINTNNYLRVKGPTFTVDWWRNDTLILADGPLELAPDRPGLYQVSLRNFARCLQFSNTAQVQFQVPPPAIDQTSFTHCLLFRELDEEFEGPVIRPGGQNLRWSYEPDMVKIFNIGPTYQLTLNDFRNNARLFITQTIGEEESPPAVIFTEVVFPLELTIDSLSDGTLQAVVNGEDEEVLPSDYYFQWYLNDAPVDQANEAFFHPEGNGGWYTLDILNLTKNCLSLDSVFLNFPTDTEEPVAAEEVIVYPNPSSDLFYVQFEPVGEKEVWLYNGAGQLLRRFRTFDQVLEIDGSRWPAGMYFLRCRLNAGGEVLRKIVRR